MSMGSRISRAAVWLVYTLLALGVAAYAIGYLFRWPNPFNSFDVNFAALRHIGVPGHFFFGALSLLLTPVQLSAAIRRRWPRVHRVCGLLYLLCVLIGGAAALRLAPSALFGMGTKIGFFVLGSLWLGITALAFQRVLAADYGGHARWMCRSIALTYSAVTLRLMLGLGVPLAGLPMSTVYPVAAWACWLVNLAVCEWLLHRPCGRRLVSFTRSV